MPRQFDLCTGDDRKWAYAVGDAVALVFDLGDERVPATLAFAPRRAFGADGVLRLDASGGPLAPGVAGAPGGPESAAPPKDSRAAAGRGGGAPRRGHGRFSRRHFSGISWTGASSPWSGR